MRLRELPSYHAIGVWPLVWFDVCVYVCVCVCIRLYTQDPVRDCDMYKCTAGRYSNGCVVINSRRPA